MDKHGNTGGFVAYGIVIVSRTGKTSCEYNNNVPVYHIALSNPPTFRELRGRTQSKVLLMDMTKEELHEANPDLYITLRNSTATSQHQGLVDSVFETVRPVDFNFKSAESA